MKNISTLFSLLILLCLFSCGKERCNGVCVEGIVTDFGNGMPIENVFISIYEKGGQLLDTVRTDENGLYTACVDDIGSLSLYRAELEKEGYWEHHGAEFFESEAMDMEHELRAEAWVRVKAMNVDTIEGNQILLSVANGNSITIFGGFGDFDDLFLITGDIENEIRYKPNIIDGEFIFRNIFTPSYDTTLVEILY